MIPKALEIHDSTINGKVGMIEIVILVQNQAE